MSHFCVPTASRFAPLCLALAWATASAVADEAPPAARAASAVAPAASAVAPAAAAVAPAAALPPSTVEQPRSFGHTLGDVLTQRVLLQQTGRHIEPAALPPADRVGPWLERRAARIESAPLGQRWLAIDYQVINAPRALMATALPALTIATQSGASLSVAEWPISIGPLTPATTFGQGDLQPLRPDRAVEPVSTAGLERQLRLSLAALAAVLLAWAGWWAWRNAREAQRLPFAQAWHRLRRLDEADPDAWLAVHQALNRTAGRAVHSATLPRLLTDAPQLQPLRAQLEAFYRYSSDRFFAGQPGGAGAGQAFALRALCRDLRDAEKRHHT